MWPMFVIQRKPGKTKTEKNTLNFTEQNKKTHLYEMEKRTPLENIE